MLTGGCYCGATGYEVADEFAYAMNCHCSQCRRTTGAAFKPMAGIEIGKFNLTKGADGLLIVGDRAAAHDVHCGTWALCSIPWCGRTPLSMSRWGHFWMPHLSGQACTS